MLHESEKTSFWTGQFHTDELRLQQQCWSRLEGSSEEEFPALRRVARLSSYVRSTKKTRRTTTENMCMTPRIDYRTSTIESTSRLTTLKCLCLCDVYQNGGNRWHKMSVAWRKAQNVAWVKGCLKWTLPATRHVVPALASTCGKSPSLEIRTSHTA